MRKSLLAVFTSMFIVVGGVVAASVSAQPVDPVAVQFPVAGTVSSAPGEAGVPFDGTVTVDRFLERDGELAVQGRLEGRLAGAGEAAFVPFDVTISAFALASDEGGSGCTVDISTTNAFIEGAVIVFLDGAQFSLGESAEPDAARELCRVVRTAAKDSADQQALARALNKVLRSA